MLASERRHLIAEDEASRERAEHFNLPPVEPETGRADNLGADFAYGEEISTYTASVASSIYNYPSKHGRIYHA